MKMRRLLVSGFAVGMALSATAAAAQSWHGDKLVDPGAIRTMARSLVRTWEQGQGPEETERISRTFKVGKAGALDLSSLSGDVTVTGGSGDEIVVEAVKRVHNRKGDAKQQLAEVQVEMTERAGRVEVRPVYTRRHSRVSVDFTVRVPAGASVAVKSYSGDVRVSDVKGDLRAETMSGDTTVLNPGQLSLAKSISGDVEVTSASSDGDVTVSSMSGDVVVKGLKARGVEANTVAGDLRLYDVTIGRAAMKSISGTLEYHGTLAKGGRYEMKSHSGDVRLAIPEAVGFEIDASTFSGSVRSDLPVTMTSVGTGEPDTRHRRSLRGTYGGGGAMLVLSSFSGDIAIVKR